jgi:hypothetical protein
MSILFVVKYADEVNTITVYATLFMYYPLLVDVLSILTYFGSVYLQAIYIRFYENYCTYNESVVFGYN